MTQEEASAAAWRVGPGEPPHDQASAALRKLLLTSPCSGQGWEQQTPHLQPSAGPVTAAFILFATGGLNISSHLREKLGICIRVVGGGR